MGKGGKSRGLGEVLVVGGVEPLGRVGVWWVVGWVGVGGLGVGGSVWIVLGWFVLDFWVLWQPRGLFCHRILVRLGALVSLLSSPWGPL